MPRKKRFRLSIPRLSPNNNKLKLSGAKQTMVLNGNSNNDQNDLSSVDGDESQDAEVEPNVFSGTGSSSSATPSNTFKVEAKKIDLAKRLVLPSVPNGRHGVGAGNITPTRPCATTIRAPLVSPVFISCKKTSVAVNGESSHQTSASRMHSRFSIKKKRRNSNAADDADACDDADRNGDSYQSSTVAFKKTPVNGVKSVLMPIGSEQKVCKAVLLSRSGGRMRVTVEVTDDADDEVRDAADKTEINSQLSSAKSTQLNSVIMPPPSLENDEESSFFLRPLPQKPADHQFAVPLPTDTAKSLLSRSAVRRKLPFKPSERHVRREPAVAAQYDPVVVPSYAAWFKFDAIHPIEQRALPEFFYSANQRSKNRKTYVHIRNLFVNIYRSTPCDYLSATAIRRMTGGDVCSCIRIHAFLEQWGLINYQAGRLPPLEVQIQQLARRAAERELEADSHGMEEDLSSDDDADVDDDENASETASGFGSRPITPKNAGSRLASPVRHGDTPTHRQSQHLLKTFLSRSSSSVITDSNDNSIQSTPVSSDKHRANMCLPSHTHNLHPHTSNSSSLLLRTYSAPDTSAASSSVVVVAAGMLDDRVLKTPGLPVGKTQTDAVNVTEFSKKRLHLEDDDDDGNFIVSRKGAEFLPGSGKHANHQLAGASSPKRQKKPLLADEKVVGLLSLRAEQHPPLSQAVVTQKSAQPWTDNERFRLVQGLHDFGDDWNRVARHVGRPTAECITAFMQLPIEDEYIKRWSLFEVPRLNAITPWWFEPSLKQLCGGSEKLAALALFASIIDRRVVSAAVAGAHNADKIVSRQLPTRLLRTALQYSSAHTGGEADAADSDGTRGSSSLLLPPHVAVARRVASSLNMPWMVKNDDAQTDREKPGDTDLGLIFIQKIAVADTSAELVPNPAEVTDDPSETTMSQKAAELLLRMSEQAHTRRAELEQTVTAARVDITQLRMRKLQLQYEHYMQNDHEYSRAAADYELDCRLLICDRLRAAHEQTEARNLIARLQTTSDLAVEGPGSRNNSGIPPADSAAADNASSNSAVLGVGDAIAAHIRKHKSVPAVPSYAAPSVSTVVPFAAEQQPFFSVEMKRPLRPLFPGGIVFNAGDDAANRRDETSPCDRLEYDGIANESLPHTSLAAPSATTAVLYEERKNSFSSNGKRNITHEISSKNADRQRQSHRKPSISDSMKSSRNMNANEGMTPATSNADDDINSFL